MSTPGNSLNITAAGLVKFDGTATFSGVTTTQHDVLVGAASNGITSVTPSTAQKFLVSNGTSADPSFKSLSVVKQVFTGNNTYTPTSGMVYCVIECCGGGGAGGGGASAGAGNYSTGAGGGAGEYAVGVFSAATIGASQSVTIGAGGTGNSGADGGNGGNTSVGSTLISANGGSGGGHSAASTSVAAAGGAGGSGGTGGSYRISGQAGFGGWAYVTPFLDFPGVGASNPLGFGGAAVTNGTGGAGTGYGSGGGGAGDQSTSTARTGGAGGGGIVIVTEYVIS